MELNPNKLHVGDFIKVIYSIIAGYTRFLKSNVGEKIA